MTEYRASAENSGDPQRFGPLTFQRRVFTDSDGHQVTAWCCMSTRHGVTNRRARTRTRALLYWLQADWQRRKEPW